MSPTEPVPPPAAAAGPIDWSRTVFRGACLGGALWATIARLTVYSGPDPAWLHLGGTTLAALCLVLVAGGVSAVRRGRTARVREAGIAVLIATLTGGSLAAIGVAVVVATP